MPYVYSTATCSTDYAVYKKTGNRDVAQVERKITIHGGANVATKYPNLHTPRGLVTQVSEEDLAILEQDYHFKQHVELGFLSVDKRKIEVEKVIPGMQAKDKSAPRTPDDPEFKNTKIDSGENTTTKGVSYAGAKGKK